MVSKSKSVDSSSKRQRPPATTPEGRERQLIAAAIDLAERQLLDGTASSQVITHFLKLASTRNRLEEEKITHENDLLQARVHQIKSQERTEELYANALKAMQRYQGQADDDEDPYED